MALPKNCTECGTRLTSANRASNNGYSPDINDTCEPCMEYFGWENTHSDEGHDLPDVENDPQAIADCPVCQDQKPGKRTRKANPDADTTAKTWSSHAACKHPKTPKDRAACRKARAAKA